MKKKMQDKSFNIQAALAVILCFCLYYYQKFDPLPMPYPNVFEIPEIYSVQKEYYRFCVPFVQKQSYSSPSDLAITCCFFHEKNMALNLFSIRQSGCQATIVIICDESIQFTAAAIKMINCLKVKVIQSKIPGFMQGVHTDMIRDNFVTNYLKRNKNIYQRVFFFDAFDVFFESDPFQYFSESKLYLFKESTQKIKWNRSNRKWIENCYDRYAFRLLRNQYIVCSGTIAAGSIDEFIKFYTILYNENNWPKCVVDQGSLNYFLHTGLFQRRNLSYSVFDHVGPIQTLDVGLKRYDYYHWNNNKYLALLNIEGRVASIAHQYTRKPEHVNSYYSRCQIASFLGICNSSSTVIEHEYHEDLYAPLE